MSKDNEALPSIGYRFFHWFALSFFRALFHLRVIGREKLVDDRPCIVVANHQSFLDPPCIGQLYETQMHALARHSLWDLWPLGHVLPHCNCIPINQTRPDPKGIMRLLRVIRDGGRVIIFPEGSRSEDGEIHDAQAGIGLILSQLKGVTVQPIRIAGAYESLPIHGKRLRFKTITLSVGDPYEIDYKEDGMTRREAQRAVGREVMDRIRELPIDC